MPKPKMKEFLRAMGRMQEEDFVTTEEFHKIFTAVMEAVKLSAVRNKDQIQEISAVADRKAKELEDHFKTLLDAVDKRMQEVRDGERGADGETPIAGIDYPDYDEIRDFIRSEVATLPSLDDIEERIKSAMTIDEVKRGLEQLEGNDRLSFEAINGIEQFIDETVRKMGAELRRGPMAITGGGTNASSGGSTNITDQNGTAWRVFYTDGSGDVTELALGASGSYLQSQGASSAPTWATPAGSGDVVKVGTPVDGQIGVWTGDGTIEGDAALTFDTTTDSLVIAASGN